MAIYMTGDPVEAEHNNTISLEGNDLNIKLLIFVTYQDCFAFVDMQAERRT